MALSQVHQVFLQTFMSRGVMSGREVRETFRKLINKYKVNALGEDLEESIAAFVKTINNQIKHFRLIIRKGFDEVNGTHHYVLVNTMNNDLTKKAANFQEQEMEFFKRLVFKIMEDSKHRVSKMAALNLVNTTDEQLKRMSKMEAETFLQRLENEKWLVMMPGGLTLDVRAIVELEPYLKSHFSDYVKNCDICNRISVQGQSCHACEVRLHYHCANTFFKDRTEKKCPNPQCGEAWPEEAPHEEEPDDDADEEQEVVEVAEDDEDNEDDESNAST